MTSTVRRSVLVVLVSLLVVAAGVFAAQLASAASAAPVVYVATGENFPDALGAASAAAVRGGPVLLVTKTTIPAETKAELSRLSPDVIYVAGGTAVVSDAVFNQLKAYAPTVTRVAGANRYATAAAVSESAFPATGGGDVSALTAQVAALQAEVDALQAMLSGVARNGNVLEFSGMNLQIVNGAGTTSTSNGVGNVIIGYNDKPPAFSKGDRGGSHYIIVGDEHTYTGYAGIVNGYRNTATGEYASILGGRYNAANTWYAAIFGGESNTASNVAAAVFGGKSNTASHLYASVVGGSDNAAGGMYSSLLGGNTVTVSGNYETHPYCGCTP